MVGKDFMVSVSFASVTHRAVIDISQVMYQDELYSSTFMTLGKP